MKISLILTALIIGLAAVFGVPRQLRINKLTTTWKGLESHAEDLEIPTDPSVSFSATSRSRSVSERAAREKEVEEFATYLTEFAQRMQKAEESGEADQSEFQEEITEVILKMTNLSTEDLRTLFKAFSEDDTLDKRMKEGLIGFSIMMMASENPESALILALQARDSLGEENDHLLQMTLAQYAQKDPTAAAQWLIDHKNHLSESDSHIYQPVISQAATKDFQVALELIKTLELENAHGALARSVTPERANELLAALEKNKISEANRQQIFSSLASSRAFLTDFKTASSWLNEADLSPQDRSNFIQSIHYWSTKENVSEWLSWVGQQEVADEDGINKRNSTIASLINNWAQEDFAAAGEWINQQPDGVARDHATLNYARTISRHEPAAAADWADALPSGPDKTRLVQTIYRNFKTKDPEGAAAFAQKHGLEENAAESQGEIEAILE